MKIGLGMIVRNEEIDLQRCLESFLPQVDIACIIDTGSTDKTMEIALDMLSKSGKPYILKTYLGASDPEGRMCDFAKARNVYIRELEEFIFDHEDFGVDYIFSADADDIYISDIDLHAYIEKNPADIYMTKYWTGEDCFFMSYKIWKLNSKMKYVGKVHEVLTINWNLKILQSTIEIKHAVGSHEGQEHGGDRNRRILYPEIYPSLRSIFYWANEHVDIGKHNEAIKWYLEYIRRCKEGEHSWNDELAHCYWRAARWLQHLGDFLTSDILCKELVTMDPSWSEAWCQLAYNSSVRQDFESMRKYALRALENTFVSRLFSEQDKYSSVPANMLLFLNQKEKIDAK